MTIDPDNGKWVHQYFPNVVSDLSELPSPEQMSVITLIGDLQRAGWARKRRSFAAWQYDQQGVPRPAYVLVFDNGDLDIGFLSV